MKVGFALLLLLIGGIHGETVSERKKDAFPRVMTMFDEINEKISTSENRTKILESQTEKLEVEVEELRQQLHGYLHYCPDLNNPIDGVPANSKPVSDKRTEGSVVNIPCGEDYYQCGNDATATCNGDGMWTVSGSSNCVEKTFAIQQPPDPTYFPCELPSDCVITVEGIPTDYNHFAINFLDDNDNYILHHNPRFNHGGFWKTTIVDRRINYSWGSGLTLTQSFPYEVNRSFKLIFKLARDIFTVYEGDEELYSFSSQGRQVTKMTYGGVKIDYTRVIYP